MNRCFQSVEFDRKPALVGVKKKNTQTIVGEEKC